MNFLKRLPPVINILSDTQYGITGAAAEETKNSLKSSRAGHEE
jgi:RNase P/RNase MRP subunit p29